MRAGLLAAAITAVYLYLVEYAGALMTESFYIVGILWMIDVGMRVAVELASDPHARGLRSRGRALRLGLELGMAVAFTLLMRQVIIGFLIVIGVWLFWVARRRRALSVLARLGLIAAATAALLTSPFIVRNYRVFGQLVMPNTNAGITFFWANHPIYGTRFEAVLSPSHGVSYQELIPPELRSLNEAELDKALLVRGLRLVLDDPFRYVMLSLSRIPVYFQFWPSRDSTLLSNTARVLSSGLFLPFMLYGVFNAVADLRKRGTSLRAPGLAEQDSSLHMEYVVLLLSFIVVYTAVHLASWANVRYRLPVDVVLIVFAGAGIADLVSWVAGPGGLAAPRRCKRATGGE
jgi:hypothetical protein